MRQFTVMNDMDFIIIMNLFDDCWFTFSLRWLCLR
jgi:hypothetical protein